MNFVFQSPRSRWVMPTFHALFSELRSYPYDRYVIFLIKDFEFSKDELRSNSESSVLLLSDNRAF